jgi:flagellin
MFEFRNVLDVTYGAYVVQGMYSGVGSLSTTTAPDRDAAVATIKELMQGDTAAVRQSAKNSSTAVSIVQVLKEVLDGVQGKLAKMKALTAKAGSEVYSQTEKEDMQEQFEEIAKEINTYIKSAYIKSAEYEYNKIFTSAGKSISVPIGNGSSVDIFAKDLSVDIEGLNLVTGASGAAAWVKSVIDDVSEYDSYFDKQYERLAGATGVIESRMASVMGIDMSDFDMSVAREVVGHTASKIVEQLSILYGVQANSEPERVLQLLKDNVQSLVDSFREMAAEEQAEDSDSDSGDDAQ